MESVADVSLHGVGNKSGVVSSGPLFGTEANMIVNSMMALQPLCAHGVTGHLGCGETSL